MWILHHENTCNPTYIVPNILQPTPIHGPHITHIWVSYNKSNKTNITFLKREDSFLPDMLTTPTVNKLQMLHQDLK
jgi:hypothetical protein